MASRVVPPAKIPRKLMNSHQHCCVPFCVNDARRDKEGKISFHRFPKDKRLRQQWIWRIRRDEGPFFKVTDATPVCSAHFLSTDFKKSLTGLRKLKPGAVPSVFNFPSTSDPKPKRKSPRKRTRDSLPEPEAELSDQGDSWPELKSNKGPSIAHPDHNYAVVKSTAEEKIEAAKARIIELEASLEKEKLLRCLGLIPST